VFPLANDWIRLGVGPLLLATAGFLVIGLLKTPLRWSGGLAVIAATIWAASAPRPDVLIAGDGRGFAIRGGDGRLAVHHTGGDSFAVREWLAADADGGDVHDKSLGQGIACDPSGCIGRLADGTLVSYALNPDAYEEDCARAALVVAIRGDPPPDCKAIVIERALWRQRGALWLRRNDSDHGGAFVIESTRAKNFDRPWSPAPRPRETVFTTSWEGRHTEIGNGARDATLRQEDIEADQ
jgi:competence protein ComEC